MRGSIVAQMIKVIKIAHTLSARKDLLWKQCTNNQQQQPQAREDGIQLVCGNFRQLVVVKKKCQVINLRAVLMMKTTMTMRTTTTTTTTMMTAMMIMIKVTDHFTSTTTSITCKSNPEWIKRPLPLSPLNRPNHLTSERSYMLPKGGAVGKIFRVVGKVNRVLVSMWSVCGR